MLIVLFTLKKFHFNDSSGGRENLTLSNLIWWVCYLHILRGIAFDYCDRTR